MIQSDHEAFACISSTGTAFLGGYETFKAAQVHLATTLDAELEGTNVIAYTIGPGLVPTETAAKAIARVTPRAETRGCASSRFHPGRFACLGLVMFSRCIIVFGPAR